MSVYPTDIKQYVDGKIASGEFRSQDEFAIEAVRLYREIETRHERLKEDIQAAVDQSERGLSEPLDVENIKAELLQELDEHGQPSR